MALEPVRTVRCAIYTRKSTEEGLEQEFNTLRAQREAAEAYVAAQKHNGWICLPILYDDGGFTGANLERPALRSLLQDVEAGAIDCVLVYKVDRLSRSLIDFSRLIELFDRHKVSFVSVTQDFNTTTSIGRLTLNILLSFAQFEREMISERTRDKLSAARRKGKWIGGIPVLGYDISPRGGELVVNEVEAKAVRKVFETYRKHASIESTLQVITAAGIVTKTWASKRGKSYTGRPFSKQSLSYMLTNVIYTGRISHKKVIYPGEHAAIVDLALWEQVNQVVQQNSRQLRNKVHRDSPPLAKLLHCAACAKPMRLNHTIRHGKKYFYVTCKPCSAKTLALADVESWFTDHFSGDKLERLLPELTKISVSLSKSELTATLSDGTSRTGALAIATRPGVRSQLPRPPGRIPRVSRLMALALKLDKEMKAGTFDSQKSLASLGSVSPPRLSQILKLTNLAPAIQEHLLFLDRVERGNDVLSEKQLRRISAMDDWDEQWSAFQELKSQIRTAG